MKNNKLYCKTKPMRGANWDEIGFVVEKSSLESIG